MKFNTAVVLFSAWLSLACVWARGGTAVLELPVPGGILCGVAPSGGERSGARPAAPALSQSNLPAADTLAEPVLVDVMFLYTPQALIGAGNHTSLREKVLESVAHANYLFLNSRVNARINPVFVGRIEYTESGAMDTDVARLANGEGSLSRAATLRNDYKADIVCLILEAENMGASGYAYDIAPLRGNAARAFMGMRRAQLGKGTLVLAHELGHLFGCHHDREHAGDLNAPWLKDYRSYIFGHRLQVEGVTYVDVMSYEPGIYLPYFGNPRISLDGVPLGVPEGESRPSDPARTMNETAPYVARYRTALSRMEFESGQYEVAEHEGSLTLKLKRTGDLSSSTRVTISIDAGSAALAGADYIRPQVTMVSFATNQAEASFSIALLADDLPEAAEALRLSLTSPLSNHGIGQHGETSILIRDFQPVVRVSDQVFKESHRTIEIGLLAPEVPSHAYPEFIKWRLRGESASPGEDYVDAAGQIAVRRVGLPHGDNGFSINLSPEPVAVSMLDDDRPEKDEILHLILEGAAVQHDGQVYVYEAVTNTIRIADDDRLGTALDGPVVPAPRAGMNLAVRHDGKFLVWGGIAPARSMDRLSIALLGPDGAPDADFRPPEFQAGHRKIEGLGSAQIDSVEFLPDGKFLVAGRFSRVNGQARSQLVRLNSDGSLDESFGRQLVLDGSIYELSVQRDGQILVGGAFERINGERHAFIARLNEDGSIDETFKPKGGPSSNFTVFIFAIAPQSDGKILIGGFFEKFDGIPTPNIARLHGDGRLDSTFTLQGASGPVSRIALQSDGRIVLSGFFDTVNGRPSRKLARINADGSADPGFRAPLPNGEVREVLPLPDGRLLVSGTFTRIANANRRFIALLNPDGTLDEKFDPGAGPDQFLGPLGNAISRAMTIHANGSLYIAGQFETFNGLPAGGIVRLKIGDPGSALVEPIYNLLAAPNGFFPYISFKAHIFPGASYVVESSSDFAVWAEVGEIHSPSFEHEVEGSFPGTRTTHRFFRLRNPGADPARLARE